MKLIATQTITTTGISSITFFDIPQSFTDLYFLISARSTSTDSTNSTALSANFGGTITQRSLSGNSTTGVSDTQTFGLASRVTSSVATANTFGNGAFYLPNYSVTGAKSGSSDSVTENNATAAFQTIAATSTTATSPITLFTFGLSDNFVVGSTISLYGILKGSDGITTAT
jgi:hypothetical protein